MFLPAYVLLLNLVSSCALQAVSAFVATATSLEKPLNIRMRLDDGRFARSWNEPFRFTIALANTGGQSVDLPGGLTMGKDVRICYLRTGGRFHYDMKMRSPRDRVITLQSKAIALESWSRTTRSFEQTPLVQVPMAGLFWTWCEVHPSGDKAVRMGSKGSRTYRSNPVLIWWQTRPVRLSVELSQIGQAIDRHRALVSKRPRSEPAALGRSQRKSGTGSVSIGLPATAGRTSP